MKKFIYFFLSDITGNKNLIILFIKYNNLKYVYFEVS